MCCTTAHRAGKKDNRLPLLLTIMALNETVPEPH
jgi:hypothetical protein